MVVRYFGIDIAADQLFKRLGTDRSGTRQNALVKVLRELGVRVRLRYDASFDVIKKTIDQDKLIIGYLDDEDHWLVVYGYAKTPRRVFVADPRPDLHCEEPWAEYEKRLNAFAMVCSRPLAKEIGDDSIESESPGFEDQLALPFGPTKPVF